MQIYFLIHNLQTVNSLLQVLTNSFTIKTEQYYHVPQKSPIALCSQPLFSSSNPWQPLIHWELFNTRWEKDWSSFFWMKVSIELPLYLNQKPIDLVYVGLFLDFLFYSIIYLSLLQDCVFIINLDIRLCEAFKVVLLSNIWLFYLLFHIN